jgi:hypothetical protein
MDPSRSPRAILTRVEQLSGPMCWQVIDIIEASARDCQYVVSRVIQLLDLSL